MIDKILIRNRFSKNLENYEENAKIQKKMAERLINFVENKNPKTVLELGCGTGFLTRFVSERLGYEKYTAIDIVEECQLYINKIDSKINFIAQDIETYINESEEKFDLIISNASLQWTENFEDTVNSLSKKLNDNGELVFSTFGKENFREIFHVLGKTLNYYSEKELLDMFSNCILDSEIHIMAFNSPKDVLKHLQLTGVNAIENTSWTKKDLIQFENGYKNYCSKRPTLTYNPIYIKIVN